MGLVVAVHGRDLHITLPHVQEPARIGAPWPAEAPLAALGIVPSTRVGERWARVVAALAVLQDDEVPRSRLAPLAMPWLDEDTFGRALHAVIEISARRGGVDPYDFRTGWPSDTRLVQVREQNGAAALSRGPYRLNPAYRVTVDRAAVASYLGAEVAPRPGEGDPDTTMAEVAALVAAGREDDAYQVMRSVNRHRSPAWAVASELAMAELCMQLGRTREAAARANRVVRMTDDVVPRVRALHVLALTRRQRDDFARAIHYDQLAMACLDPSRSEQATHRRLLIDLERSLGITLSERVAAQSRRDGWVSDAAGSAPWREATTRLRRAVELGAASDPVDPVDLAHSVMRLGAHRLHLTSLTRSDRAEVEAVTASSLHTPARVIWERAMISRELTRLQRPRASAGRLDLGADAIRSLAAVAAEDVRRGYLHQLALIERTAARVGLTLDELLAQVKA